MNFLVLHDAAFQNSHQDQTAHPNGENRVKWSHGRTVIFNGINLILLQIHRRRQEIPHGLRIIFHDLHNLGQPLTLLHGFHLIDDAVQFFLTGRDHGRSLVQRLDQTVKGTRGLSQGAVDLRQKPVNADCVIGRGGNAVIETVETCRQGRFHLAVILIRDPRTLIHHLLQRFPDLLSGVLRKLPRP